MTGAQTPASGAARSVVAKLVPLLEAVAAAEDGISVREIARSTGIDRSAVSRLFRQLEDLDMVEQSSISGRFLPGPRLLSMSSMLNRRGWLERVALPVLEDLVERFDETVYLIVREFDQVRYQERVESRQAIRYVIDLGDTSPLHVGAGGRAVLMGMPVEDVEGYLEHAELVPYTSDTVTSPEAIRRMVDEDRARGYTVSFGERTEGGRGVAAPLFRADGECLGALMWTCPQVRFDPEQVPEVAAAVRAASRELSQRLGWEGSYPGA
jgi:IclR family acetate operon transcriptional repressor